MAGLGPAAEEVELHELLVLGLDDLGDDTGQLIGELRSCWRATEGWPGGASWGRGRPSAELETEEALE